MRTRSRTTDLCLLDSSIRNAVVCVFIGPTTNVVLYRIATDNYDVESKKHPFSFIYYLRRVVYKTLKKLHLKKPVKKLNHNITQL